MICDFYGSIYGLCSPSGKWYIGQTTVKDVYEYIRKNYSLQNGGQRRKLSSALLKYGFDSFKIKIFVHLFDKESLDIAEIGFIEMYDSINHGYNLQLGGFKGKCSDETKLKMSEAQIGKIISEESRLKISKTLKGHSVSNETRMKISESQIGRISSEETNEKRRVAMTGKKIHTDEHKIKVGLSKIKYEYELLSPNGELFKTNSLNAFEKEHDLHRESIIRNGFSKGWKLMRQHLLDDNQTPVMITLL